MPLLIDWWKFLPALLLLLTPVALFEGKRVLFRDIERDWSQHWPQVFGLWLHGFDFARAALGTWLLLDSLQAIPNAHGFGRYLPLVTQGLVRVVAVFLQTAICREPDSANAPFAFVTGLLLAGMSPVVAALALALAIPLAMGSRSPIAFFPVVALAYAGIGFWFGSKTLLLKTLAGACAPLVPWLWSLLFHRSLVLPYLERAAPKGTRPA